MQKNCQLLKWSRNHYSYTRYLDILLLNDPLSKVNTLKMLYIIKVIHNTELVELTGNIRTEEYI